MTLPICYGAHGMIKHPAFARKISAVALLASIASLSMLGACTSRADANPPTQQIVEQTMKGYWDKTETSTNPKSTLTLNSVRFGKAYRATVQEVQVEGIPEDAMVTPAVVDFTVRTYYNSETQAVRRAREARVYKDKMDDWRVMTGSVHGQDSTTIEPAAG